MPISIGVLLEPSLYLQPFRTYSAPELVRAHTRTQIHTLQVILYPASCNVLHWRDKNVVAELPPPTMLPLLQVDCSTDIVFMVDESRSIGVDNFPRLKLFLSQVVSRFDIDSGRTRVGLVTFATNVGTVLNLNARSSVASLQSAILSLSYTGGGATNSTNTAAALRYVRTRMLTSAAGNRYYVHNTVVVITDGESNNIKATVVSCFVHFYHYCIIRSVLLR